MATLRICVGGDEAVSIPRFVVSDAEESVTQKPRFQIQLPWPDEAHKARFGNAVHLDKNSIGQLFNAKPNDEVFVVLSIPEMGTYELGVVKNTAGTFAAMVNNGETFAHTLNLIKLQRPTFVNTEELRSEVVVLDNKKEKNEDQIVGNSPVERLSFVRAAVSAGTATPTQLAYWTAYLDWTASGGDVSQTIVALLNSKSYVPSPLLLETLETHWQIVVGKVLAM